MRLIAASWKCFFDYDYPTEDKENNIILTIILQILQGYRIIVSLKTVTDLSLYQCYYYI